MLRIRPKNPGAVILQLLCYFGAQFIMVPLLPHFGDRLLLGLFVVFVFHMSIRRLEWEAVLVHGGREFRVGDEVYSLPGAPPFSGPVVGFVPNEPTAWLVVAFNDEKMAVEPKYVRKAVL